MVENQLYLEWMHLYQYLEEIKLYILKIKYEGEYVNKISEIDELQAYFNKSSNHLLEILPYISVDNSLVDLNLYLDPTMNLTTLVAINGELSIDSILQNSYSIRKCLDSIGEINTKIRNTGQDNSNTFEFKNFYLKVLEIKDVFSLKNNVLNANENLKKVSTNYSEVTYLTNEIKKLYEDFSTKNSQFNTFLDMKSNLEEKKLYDEIYEKELNQADKYRLWAIIIFICVGFLITAIIISAIIQNILYLSYPEKFIPIEFGLSHFLKLMAIYSLTIPAWYLTREASKHRKVAYKAKILGTELTALPFYMNQLDNSQRIQMRIKMADKFFGQELYSDKNSENNADSNEYFKTMTEAIKALSSKVNSRN